MCSPENFEKKSKFDPFHYFFFHLRDLGILQMTLEIWEPQTVGVSNDQLKYRGNRW